MLTTKPSELTNWAKHTDCECCMFCSVSQLNKVRQWMQVHMAALCLHP